MYVLLSSELKSVLQYITCVPAVEGNSIVVSFDTTVGAAGISANTCGRELKLSTFITDETLFLDEISAVIGPQDFTMP